MLSSRLLPTSRTVRQVETGRWCHAGSRLPCNAGWFCLDNSPTRTQGPRVNAPRPCDHERAKPGFIPSAYAATTSLAFIRRS
ncbi:unnamed protein product [Lampetra planeri]